MQSEAKFLAIFGATSGRVSSTTRPSTTPSTSKSRKKRGKDEWIKEVGENALFPMLLLPFREFKPPFEDLIGEVEDVSKELASNCLV